MLKSVVIELGLRLSLIGGPQFALIQFEGNFEMEEVMSFLAAIF